jgi:hypothetical protein
MSKGWYISHGDIPVPPVLIRKFMLGEERAIPLYAAQSQLWYKGPYPPLRHNTEEQKRF